MAKNCFIYETLNQVSEMKMTKENGLMTLSGVFGVCGVRNNNKRVYEKNNYAKCVKEMQDRINENKGIPGELEHPQTMNITLENISHKITKIDIDENGVVTGEIQLLNTPKGKIAQAIVEGGLPLFVSSRATGNVDKNGNVTLEAISSYDLVGTPGFSQAKMHLNESQVCESLGENTWFITEKEEENNTEDMENTEFKDLLEKLEERITELEKTNEELREQLEDYEERITEAEQNQIDKKQLADGIQNWIIEEYSSELQGWILEHLKPAIIKENKEVFAEEVAPKIESWVVNEFAPEVEKWITEQYSPEVEKWVINEVAPGLQDWIINEYSPSVEDWLNESYSDKVREMITETKDNKLKSISETLELLESLDVKKPKYSGRTITESVADEPLYIQNMPEECRPKYNMASSEVKESINRRAKLYDFAQEGALERFWENINFDEIKPIQETYRDLNTVEDIRERQIRESFRRRRSL